MSGDLWDRLDGALPPDVRNAVRRAAFDALHRGADQDGFFAAGITELMRHVVLKTEHDRQVEQVVRHQRSTFQEGRQAANDAYARGVAEGREAQAALARVYRLVDHRRKTVRMEDLREAIERRAEES